MILDGVCLLGILFIVIIMLGLVCKWSKPKLYGSGVLKQFIAANSKIVREKYRPPLVCFHPILQFVIRTKYEKVPDVAIKKHVFKLSDGGAVAFDKIYLNKAKDTTAVSEYVVIIVPGLRESTHSTKMLATANCLLVNGFDNVHILNYRVSCSIPMKSPKISLAFGEHNHVDEAIVDIERRYPEKKIVLVGACMGSMCIIDYLSTGESQRSSIVGAVIHSCSWKMTVDMIKDTSEPTYSLFTKKLVEDTKKRLLKSSGPEETKIQEEFFKNFDMEKMRSAKTMWDIEEYGVRRYAGLPSVAEYYKRISPIYKCHKIQKPVIVINARDDPMMCSFKEMELDKFVKNPNLVLWSTAAGGHVSFVESLFPVRSYLDRVIPECTELLCEFNKQEPN